jgi:hypothetical protein
MARIALIADPALAYWQLVAAPVISGTWGRDGKPGDDELVLTSVASAVHR